MNESTAAIPDLNVPAPPWPYNPSAWKQRVPICLLAAVAFVVAAYMALYQWRLINDVWDPVFGEQSKQVLDSAVSERMRRWFRVPDAAFGAFAYLGGSHLRAGRFDATLAIPTMASGPLWVGCHSARDCERGAGCSTRHSRRRMVFSLPTNGGDLAHFGCIGVRRGLVKPAVPPPSLAQDAPRPGALGYFLGTAITIGRGSSGFRKRESMMWARVVEVMIGCWLAISPFVFRHPPDQSAWWTNDLISGFIVVTLALRSFWTPTRHAHLALSGIAAWLIGFAYLSAAHPIPPALQNDMVVGLLLLMFAIIPDEATLPPKAWREFYKLGITGEQRR